METNTGGGGEATPEPETTNTITQLILAADEIDSLGHGGQGEEQPVRLETDGTSPFETAPIQATPIGTTPIETTPIIQTTPIETTPMETTIIEATPFETAPIQATPIETSSSAAPPLIALPPPPPECEQPAKTSMLVLENRDIDIEAEGSAAAATPLLEGVDPKGRESERESLSDLHLFYTMFFELFVFTYFEFRSNKKVSWKLERENTFMIYDLWLLDVWCVIAHCSLAIAIFES